MVARNRFTLREDVNESELSEQRVTPSLLGGVQIPVTRSKMNETLSGVSLPNALELLEFSKVADKINVLHF